MQWLENDDWCIWCVGMNKKVIDIHMFLNTDKKIYGFASPDAMYYILPSKKTAHLQKY